MPNVETQLDVRLHSKLKKDRRPSFLQQTNKAHTVNNNTKTDAHPVTNLMNMHDHDKVTHPPHKYTRHHKYS